MVPGDDYPDVAAAGIELDRIDRLEGGELSVILWRGQKGGDVGRKQVAAGYILYGSSTMLVYTTGHGVVGFTYENSLGEFFLSHPSIRIPATGTVLSSMPLNIPRPDFLTRDGSEGAPPPLNRTFSPKATVDMSDRAPENPGTP